MRDTKCGMENCDNYLKGDAELSLWVIMKVNAFIGPKELSVIEGSDVIKQK